jgi:H+/gluconate symporter-like permease
MGILVISTSKAILAIVPIYCSLGRLNTLIKAPLRTPPVPISPALNPERAPHIFPIIGVFSPDITGRIHEKTAKIINTTPKTTFKILGSIIPAILAPTTVAIILGTPKRKKIFLFR